MKSSDYMTSLSFSGSFSNSPESIASSPARKRSEVWLMPFPTQKWCTCNPKILGAIQEEIDCGWGNRCISTRQNSFFILYSWWLWTRWRGWCSEGIVNAQSINVLLISVIHIPNWAFRLFYIFILIPFLCHNVLLFKLAVALSSHFRQTLDQYGCASFHLFGVLILKLFSCFLSLLLCLV